MERNTLRVAAPLTFKSASFQEHDGPDAGPVMDTKPLDVEDQSALLRSL
jgi:hypothetical protein